MSRLISSTALYFRASNAEVYKENIGSYFTFITSSGSSVNTVTGVGVGQVISDRRTAARLVLSVVRRNETVWSFT
jgi:hypothetical protein